MFVAIGVLFIAFEGTSGLEGLYASGGATDLAFSVERRAEAVSERAPISLAVLGLAFAGYVIFKLSQRRKKPAGRKG
jgi:hypothetical protein